MTSLIPKTSVGVNSRKYNRNQSCMVHGTSEIGFVFPTYARSHINDATINLSTRTGVRLSTMFVPTMGKLEVRNYHVFVPYNRCFAPYDAFLAREPFNFGSFSRIPQKLPFFKMGEILAGLFFKDSLMPNFGARGRVYHQGGASFAQWIQSGQFNVGLTASIYVAPDVNSEPGEYALVDWENDNTHEDSLNNLFNGIAVDNDCYGYTTSDDYQITKIVPSMLKTSKGEYFIECEPDVDGDQTYPYITGLSSVDDGSQSHIVSEYLSSISFPSLENCDFSYECKKLDKWYTVCFNFNGSIKRLRNVCLGLGYSFNPYDREPDSLLKLFAYYRAWFSLFAVTRDINFNDTACARLFRYFSDGYNEDYSFRVIGSEQTKTAVDSWVYQFFKDLCDLTYTCPADYFTSSVMDTQPENMLAVQIGDGVTGTFGGQSAIASQNQSPAVRAHLDQGGNHPVVDALAIKIAQRLLTWVNKNTVVGKKIQDILYARYGKIQTDDESTEGVIKVGVDTTPIEIGIIFNQTASEGSAPLGQFSGLGSGGSRSSKHTFVTPSFGVFMTLTAVVPEMGYFQGKLRENSDGVLDSLEFPDSAYDALGYQTLRYNELVADRQFYRNGQDDSGTTSLGNYGKQPRYTHYKVGFNRVLGDISLPHMRDSMLPYTLDRYFNPRDRWLPVNDPVTARRGDIGGTNRIFDVVSPTDDHVIYQIYFDVHVNDRLKPLSLSYDTILDNDNKAVDYTHQ